MKLSWSPSGRVAARRVGLLGEAKTLVLVVSLLERRGRDNDKSDGADFSGDSGRGYAQRKTGAAEWKQAKQWNCWDTGYARRRTHADEWIPRNLRTVRGRDWDT